MPTCPHCGHEADQGSESCPLCGTPLTGPTEAGADGPGAEGAAAGTAPFEDPSVPFFRGLWETWRESLFEPELFFRRVDFSGSLARPLLYFLLVSVIAGVFTLFWRATLLSWAGEAVPVAGPQLLLSFFVTPFLALLGLLLVGATIHVVALLLAGGEGRGAGATFAVVCYSVGPLLLTVVPFGGLFGFPWSLVLQVTGLREAHRTNTGRAVMAAVSPWAVFVVLSFVLFALVFESLDGGGAWPLPY